jgi:hypothetical protein
MGEVVRLKQSGPPDVDAPEKSGAFWGVPDHVTAARVKHRLLMDKLSQAAMAVTAAELAALQDAEDLEEIRQVVDEIELDAADYTAVNSPDAMNWRASDQEAA